MKLIRLVVQVDDTTVNQHLMQDLFRKIDYIFDKVNSSPVKKLEQINVRAFIIAEEAAPEEEPS